MIFQNGLARAIQVSQSHLASRNQPKEHEMQPAHSRAPICYQSTFHRRALGSQDDAFGNQQNRQFS